MAEDQIASGPPEDEPLSVDLSGEDAGSAQEGLNAPAVDYSGIDPFSANRGLREATERPADLAAKHADAAEGIAKRLVWMLGVVLVVLIGTATSVALAEHGALAELVGFFASIVSALGTLLGGVTGYYYGRQMSGKSAP
jgi:hypothetical protein